MAVVLCLPPANFSSSSSFCATLNCRIKSDAIMIASSSTSSLARPEASPSILYSAPSSSSSPLVSFRLRAAAAGGGAIHYGHKGRLSSSLSTKNSPNGLEFGETNRIRIIVDQRGERRCRATPAQDSTQTSDPAEGSRQRLTISRSDDEYQEDGNGGQREGELAEEKESALEQERSLLETDSFAASSSASEDEVSPAFLKENGKQEGDGGFGNTAAIGTVAAGLGLVVVFGGFGSVAYVYKDQLNDFLIQFSEFLEGYGPAGYGLFVLVYAGLELLAIPAIPLTMSAGLLFGAAIGTIVVSISGTIAATGAFLIARYLARDRILAMAKGNKKFLAIDKAIGDDGFRVVTLLRLSPLLPFSLGNYLYGLTSVKLGPYVLGSWLGMLPGTWAYVSAGAISRSFIVQSESEPFFSGKPEQLWTLGLGLAATVFAASYVTRVAKEALKDIDD